MSITATVENDTIKLPAGVHVPDGTKVEITLPEEGAPEQEGGTLAWMTEFAGAIKTLPPDMAERHDHYIHGRKLRLHRAPQEGVEKFPPECHPERSGGGKAGVAQSKDPVESPVTPLGTPRDPSTAFRPAFARTELRSG